MQSIDQIFERATIRGIVDYLLFGIGPNADHRSYEERLEEPYARFEKEVAKHDPSPSVNNGELVPSARSNCTTLPKQEYHLAGLLYRSATALCQRCEPLFR